MKKIKTGDLVKVVKSNMQYGNYVLWAKTQNLTLFKPQMFGDIKNDVEGVVVAIAPHSMQQNITLCGVLINGEHVIFNVRALELLNDEIKNGDKVTCPSLFGEDILMFVGMAEDLRFKNDCVVLTNGKCVPVQFSSLVKAGLKRKPVFDCDGNAIEHGDLIIHVDFPNSKQIVKLARGVLYGGQVRVDSYFSSKLKVVKKAGS